MEGSGVAYGDLSRGMRCHRVDVPNPNFGGLGLLLSGLTTGLTATPMNPALEVRDLPPMSGLWLQQNRQGS
jgi:hypothetical protein